MLYQVVLWHEVCASKYAGYLYLQFSKAPGIIACYIVYDIFDFVRYTKAPARHTTGASHALILILILILCSPTAGCPYNIAPPHNIDIS